MRYQSAGFWIVLVIGMNFFVSQNAYSKDKGGSPLCGKDEQTIFTCQIQKSDKTLSLCASKNISKTNGYLQYRFGRSGAIELEYPTEKETSRQKFSFGRYTRYKVSKLAVAFSNNNYSYKVFDNFDNEMGHPTMEQGVIITNSEDSNKPMILLCKKRAVSSLGELEDILPCNENMSFSGCK